MDKIHICQTCGRRKAEHTCIKGKIYWRKECNHCSRLRRGKPLQYGLAKVSPKRRPNHLYSKLLLTYTCENCGWFGYCQIHHKDGNRNNNQPDNLSCLCPNCHIDIHQGKPY